MDKNSRNIAQPQSSVSGVRDSHLRRVPSIYLSPGPIDSKPVPIDLMPVPESAGRRGDGKQRGDGKHREEMESIERRWKA